MSEDQEWSRRALRAGYALVYEPRAIVRHSHAYTIASAFRRFFDSGVSAEHSYVEGDESKAALRRAGSRYAREELAWLWGTGRRRWIPYTVVYELGKFAGLQLGLRHNRLPRSLVSRLSGLPPRAPDMPAE
jgi:rhamnosyltransferase